MSVHLYASESVSVSACKDVLVCLCVCASVTDDLAANTAPSFTVDAKSIAEVNDIVEHVFLITLNRG